MNSIVVERIEANINVPELLDSVLPLFEKFAPQFQSPVFAGWSLQSNTGSYQQGWSGEFIPYNGPNNHGPSWHPQNEKEKTLFPVQDSKMPTEMMTKPFQNVIDRLEAMGLNPRRARIVRLMPGQSTLWHVDGSARFYQVRLNIPLQTNSDCFFETQQGRYHMKSDGALYFAHINQVHRAANFGKTERYHFICHAWDQRHVTQHHRYDPLLSSGESHHLNEVDLASQIKKIDENLFSSADQTPIKSRET